MEIPPRARRAMKKLDPLFRGGKTVYCSDHLEEFTNTTALMNHMLSSHVDYDPSLAGLKRNMANLKEIGRFLRVGPMAEGERNRAAGLTRGHEYP